MRLNVLYKEPIMGLKKHKLNHKMWCLSQKNKIFTACRQSRCVIWRVHQSKVVVWVQLSLGCWDLVWQCCAALIKHNYTFCMTNLQYHFLLLNILKFGACSTVLVILLPDCILQVHFFILFFYIYLAMILLCPTRVQGKDIFKCSSVQYQT